MTVFVFNATELLGYVGGFILSFALLPQVVHTYRTRSTKDLSYGWQAAYILGLVLCYVYFVLSGVTAAWVTLTFELVFALFLLAMKLRFDGCADGRAAVESGDDEEFAPCRDLENFAPMSSTGDESESNGGVGDTALSFHSIVVVPYPNRLSSTIGDAAMYEVSGLAARNKINLIWLHSMKFDDPFSGFSVSGFAGRSHLSICGNCDDGELSIDFKANGPNAETECQFVKAVLVSLKTLLLSSDGIPLRPL